MRTRQLTLAAALLLAACGAEKPPEASRAASAPTAAAAAPAAAPAPIPAVPISAAKPDSVETLAGLWRVTGVDGGAAFARNDPRLMGALLEIQREQLAWSYHPGGEFPGDTLCEGPLIGPIEGAAGDTLLHPRFSAALARLDPRSTLGPVPYAIECQGGGRWGPGQIGTAHVYLPGPGQMLMSWFGDSVLLLEHVKRPKAAPVSALPLKADDAVR